MNHLRAVYIIWYRDLLRLWRDKTRVFGSLAFPLLFLFIFGSGLSSRIGTLGPGVDFTQFIFPGIIGMTVLMGSFMAGVSVVWDREFGFLREVLYLVPQDARGQVDAQLIGQLAAFAGHFPRYRACLTIELLYPEPHALVGVQFRGHDHGRLGTGQPQRFYRALVDTRPTRGAVVVCDRDLVLVQVDGIERARINARLAADAQFTIDL